MAEAPAPRLPDHVTVPLLSLITQRSLDADYEHVAARKRAMGETPQTHPVPRRTAGLVLLVFGLLVTIAAVQTSRDASANSADRAGLIAQIDARRQAVDDLQKQLAHEQSQALSMQRDLVAMTDQLQSEHTKIGNLAARTGYAPIKGPGLRVTVDSAPGSDANQTVRDSDLSLLTDALWASGAQAISVNGQRLTVLTSFRNVGPGILVNNQPVEPPYVFDVVGDPNTIPAALLSSPIGSQWYALKNSLGFRFSVQDAGTVSLPAAAPAHLRSARIASGKHVNTTQGDNSS
jgi:uncharacterized protein YlxW (UPF0749 family)